MTVAFPASEIVVSRVLLSLEPQEVLSAMNTCTLWRRTALSQVFAEALLSNERYQVYFSSFPNAFLKIYTNLHIMPSGHNVRV